MPRKWNWSARFLALTLLAGTCFGQNPESSKFYKLDFVVKEMEGPKVVNARAYSTIVSTAKSSPPTSIRTGSRVPVPTAPGSAQFNYVEVGVNIDCRSVEEVASELSLLVTADINSTLQESTAVTPVLRSNKWTSMVIVTIGKPIVVFSSDDVTAKRQMQLELTATPIK